MARELDIRNQVRYTVKLGLYSEHAAQQLFGLRDETDDRVKVRRGDSKVEWEIFCPSLLNDVFGAEWHVFPQRSPVNADVCQSCFRRQL